MRATVGHPPPPSSSTTPTPGPQTSLRGLRVLVVDDDLMNRTIMKFKLQKSKPFAGLGVVCEEASTGEDCLSQFHAKMDTGEALWDLIVMDEHLSPDPCQLRGTQVIQLMRAAGHLGAVLSCSGNCTEADQRSYVDAGADAVWPKPFPTPEDMMQDLCELARAGALVNQGCPESTKRRPSSSRLSPCARSSRGTDPPPAPSAAAAAAEAGSGSRSGFRSGSGHSPRMVPAPALVAAPASASLAAAAAASAGAEPPVVVTSVAAALASVAAAESETLTPAPAMAAGSRSLGRAQ